MKSIIIQIVLSIILFPFIYGQVNKTYNTKIKKANTVYIVTNKVVGKEVNNYNSIPKAKLYFLNTESFDLFRTNGDKLDYTKITYGNPDSVAVYDIDFRVDCDFQYDSAYFLNVYGSDTSFQPFNPHLPVRDCYKTYDPEKRWIRFQAGYIEANKKIYLIIIHKKIQHITIKTSGVGKLW